MLAHNAPVTSAFLPRASAFEKVKQLPLPPWVPSIGGRLCVLVNQIAAKANLHPAKHAAAGPC